MSLDEGPIGARLRRRRARKRAGLIDDRRNKTPLPVRTALDLVARDVLIENTTDPPRPRIPDKRAVKPKAKPKPKRTPADRDALKRISARYQASLKPEPRPVRGESAADKAKVGAQQKRREAFEALIHGRLEPAQFARMMGGLTAAEKRDFQSYSGARSRQVFRENDPQERIAGYMVGPELAKLLPGGTPASELDPKWAAVEAAGFLPLGRGAGLGARVFRRGRQAADVTKVARPAGAEKIAAALPQAKTLRRKQEALYREERGRRAAKAERAMEQGGEAGYRAALSELKGQLPKLKFGALENFDQQTADALFTHAQRHPDLRPFEKIRTQTALKKVIDGDVPTRSEIKLLDRTFGPEVAAQIADSVPFWRKAKNAGLSVINVPRALRSSFDLSAPFRQGLFLGARHPRMFAREFAPMIRSFRSERAYEDVMDDIASRPSFGKMQDAKLQLTDLEGLSGREEGFMSNLAEDIPALGHGVRASGRAYTAFLNKFRADAFDNYLQMADAQGLDINDPQLLKSIGSWVNHATGRGSVKSLEGAMTPLNALFFSPRLIASRLQLLNPVYYAKLDPFARKQALRGAANLLGGISLTLWLAKQAGADVGVDPRSSDFGKIKFGDTRIDIAGGFQQYVVAATRLIKGETVSSTSGEVVRLEGGFAKPSRWDILGNFAENKLAPVPTYIDDMLKGETFAGDEFDPVKEFARMHTPLGLENAYEGVKSGPGAGAASVGLGSIGFGVQTYPAREPRKKPPSTRQERQTRMLTEERKNAKKLGLPDVTPEVREAIGVKAAIEQELDRLEKQQRKRKDTQVPSGKRFKLTQRQKAAAVLAALKRTMPDYWAQAKPAFDSLTDSRDIESWLRAVRDETYGAVLGDWHRLAKEA